MLIYGQQWKSRRRLQDSPLLRAEVDAIHGLGDAMAGETSGVPCYMQLVAVNGCGSKWKTDVGPQM